MSAFQALKDVCKNFEDDLRRVSKELPSAKLLESFEDNITNKLLDLSLFTSKSRLLRAKPLSYAVNPQTNEQEFEQDIETVLDNYEETVLNRIIEQKLVKSATQAHAVKKLITASDRTLDPEMLERKKQIVAALAAFQTQEVTVQKLDSVLRDREDELADLRAEWDLELAELRTMKQNISRMEFDEHDPMYQKLNGQVQKLQLMRWLASRLGVPRSRGYDWLADPQGLLRALKMARTNYNIHYFVNNS